jgi:G3E family GTPase
LKAEAYDAHGHDDHNGHHHGHDHDHGHRDQDPHDANRHDARIAAFAIDWDRPLDWALFIDWIEMLIAGHGENLLRIKGILNVAGEAAPVAVHGVQHLFHPPVMLQGWPDEDRHSRMVFITRDIPREALLASFRSFFADAKTA